MTPVGVSIDLTESGWNTMDKLDLRIEQYRDDMVELLRKLVRIPSVRGESRPGMPFGEGPAKCLEAALAAAEALGFKAENVDHYAGHADIGEGEQTLGILVHLDVVPVGDHWTVAPFDAFVKDGRVWGRGACDNKAACAEIFYAIRALMDAGIQWKKKVRVIFGCDEESAWEDMKYYKQRVKMPDFGFVPDGSFPLTNAEKGILHVEMNIPAHGDDEKFVSLVGGERPNVVLAKSTAVIAGAPALDLSGHPIESRVNESGDTVLVSTGIAAHGCTPENGENAGVRLMQCLRKNGWRGNMVDVICDLFGDKLDGEGFGIRFVDEASGALSLNLGVLEKAGDAFRLVVDIRYPVTDDYDKLLATLRERAAEYGATVRVMDHKLPLYLPLDHPLVTTLLKVYRDVTGRDDGPMSTGGGTYARTMPNAVAYGARFPDLDVDHCCHRENEFIGIDEMVRAAKVFARTILALQDVDIETTK